MARLPSFEAFWPFYLGEHARPLTRWLHFAGTTAVVIAAGVAVASGSPKLLAVTPLLGYGPAWVAHFFVEKNRPATFTYPAWSLAADFKMWGQMLQGRLWTEDLSAERASD